MYASSEEKICGRIVWKPVLKNGGVCILTIISDSDMPSYYNGFEIDEI